MAALPWPTPKVWLFELREIYALCCFYGAAGAAKLLGGGAKGGGVEFFHCFAKLVGRCEQLNASPVNDAFQSKLVSKSSLKAKAKSKCSRS